MKTELLNKEQALHRFWNKFLPSYAEGSVPPREKTPYIVYEVATSEIDAPVALTANIWNKSRSWKPLADVAERIDATIRGGYVKRIKGGYIWIKKGTPFTKHLFDDNDNKAQNVNIVVEFVTN